MKTTIFNKKALAFFGAAAILLAAVFTIGCKTDAGSGDPAPAPETFAVTFRVSGGNGNVRAKVDGKEIETGAKVEQGKTVEFTANPDYDWTIGKWTVEGGKFEKYTGTSGSTTAKVKVSAATTVSVKFTKNGYTVIFDAKGGSPVPAEQTLKYKEKVSKPSPVPTKKGHIFEGWYNKDGDVLWDFAANEVTKSTELYAKWKINEYTVTFGIEGTPANGTLKAEVGGTVINTNDKIEYGKIVTFSAAPAEYCKVEKWTIAGGAFEAGTGTEGSTTAKAKITANTKVAVSFISSIYAIVPFGTDGAGLDNYLKTAVPDTNGICYIKVTGLTAADLKGDSDSRKPSPLGKILNDNPTKKVALKLSEVSGLTDMSVCFYECISLTHAPEIPSGVTEMYVCFGGCTSLTQAPVIPSSVTNMKECFMGCKNITTVTLKCNYVDGSFTAAFYDCDKLSAGSIKVPSGQLKTYQDNAGIMDAQENWFVAE